MKRENYAYVPSNTKARDSMKLSALTAARKVNIKYEFKYGLSVDVTKKGFVCSDNSDNQLVLSHELIEISRKKFDQYETNMKDQWRDRMTSLARPLGSEIFLSNDTVGDLYGAPEFYMDQLNLEKRPDARLRYPYSLEAINAARKITFIIAQYMEAKHNAAGIVQKIYRHYRCMINFRKEVASAHFSARKIQWFIKKRKYRLQQAKARLNKMHRAAIKIQKVSRKYLAKKILTRLKKKRIDLFATRIQKWAVKWVQQIKFKKRKQRRLKNCARRLQALYRGYRQRKKISQYRSSTKIIITCFRRFFIGRYSKYIIKIQVCYKRCYTVKRLKRIQRIIRGFLGRRRFIKYRLKLISDERSRVTKEFVFVNQRLLTCAYNNSWCGDSEGDVEIITKHMAILDSKCTNIMNGTLYSKEYRETSNLKRNQKIVYSVLFAFSNRPNNCIDCFGVKLAKKYLIPSKGKQNEIIYKNLECIPMHNISTLALSNILEPRYSLQLRLLVKGYLPDILYGEAVLLRRWTKQLNKAIFKALSKYRRLNPPNKFCKTCLEPFTFSSQFKDHLICHRNHSFSWINKCFLSDMEMSLYHKIDALIAYPKILRNKQPSPVKKTADGDDNDVDKDRNYKRSNDNVKMKVLIRHYIEQEDENVDFLDELVSSGDEKETEHLKKQKQEVAKVRSKEEKTKKISSGISNTGRSNQSSKLPPPGPPARPQPKI